MDDMFNPNEPLIQKLRMVIRFSVRCLAVLMTLVILWGVVDVAWEIYGKLRTPPVMLMNISDILATFGAFMAVLIAIEIFINITIYLRDDVIHVKIVMATALMAIARKVIILDFKVVEPEYIFATAALVFAASIGYWLVVRYADARSVSRTDVERCFEHPDECRLEETDKKI
jgi:uncharacterized membrane protein (DUF373 family)